MTNSVRETGGEVVGTTSLLVLPNLTYECRTTAFFEPMVVCHTRHTNDGAYDRCRALQLRGWATGFRLCLG